MTEQTTKQKKLKPFWKRILRDVLIVAVILFVFAYGYCYFFLNLTPGSGPTPGDIPAEPFSAAWSAEPHLLLG